MGEINTIINDYLSDNTRFADLINVGLFHGKQLVKPKQLKELDTKAHRKAKETQGDVSKEYVRDQLKCWCIGDKFLILGVEAEQNIQYAMPIRVQNYDSIHYHQNYRDIKKRHREN